MKTSQIINRLSVILLFCSLSTLIFSQENTGGEAFVPHVGQPGKDVIWVPTPDALVNRMLEIAGVTSMDVLIDLGSGDGRTVIAAAKLGATATGIEYNPEMVELSIKKAEEAGVSARAKFIKADLFEYDFSSATVITMFLLPEINLRLRPRLLDLKPGTRIVSNTFTMGEWDPDYEVTVNEIESSWNTALMWIVPAKIGGSWKLSPGVLKISQSFQMINGTYEHDNKISLITDGRINGDTISFKIDGAKYTGHMTGKDSILGTLTTNSAKSDWAATRSENN